jgi:hypothetical protein
LARARLFAIGPGLFFTADLLAKAVISTIGQRASKEEIPKKFD